MTFLTRDRFWKLWYKASSSVMGLLLEQPPAHLGPNVTERVSFLETFCPGVIYRVKEQKEKKNKENLVDSRNDAWNDVALVVVLNQMFTSNTNLVLVLYDNVLN